MTQVTVPVAIGVAAVAAVLALLLVWSTRQVDRVAMERQAGLLQLVLRDSITGLSHDQEASTVWDDAVLQLRRRPLDMAWLDGNLGVWLHSYYGHDGAYIIDPRDRTIYAMRDGRRISPSSLEPLPVAITTLLRELRWRLRHPGPPLGDAVRSPGAADLAIIGRRPAIVSAKPIIPDTERVRQAAGSEPIHVSIRFLDGNFADHLAKQYGFDGARFVWALRLSPGEQALPLTRRDGHVIGYLAWRPFTPGARVQGQIGPVLVAALLLVGLIKTLLIARLRRSVTQLQASRAQAEHLAYHDVLTGLPNRALFEDRLRHALARVRRDGSASLALLYLDLDRLKHVNDTLGHPAGDALIRELGRRLAALLRETDTVARLGGDEFAIVQTDVRSPADTEVLCMRLVEAIARPFEVFDNQVHVGISIGVATAPDDSLDPVELSRKADIALYHSKTSGRGRYTLFHDEMDSTIQSRQSIIADLRKAIAAGDQFTIDYQPLYTARAGRLAGVEALVRWNHPALGLISPAAFVPVAEEAGLIEPIGEWVLRRACIESRDWPVERVSVNVSAVQLRNPAFADRVLEILDVTGMDPCRLELEITETCLIENAVQSRPNIIALRAAGVRIALDDFGTGYSSLSHLRQFDVDRVKIDRSFVNAILPGQGGSAIIQAIVDLAQATGLSVTAEGVETSEQSDFLSSVGCDELQGFLLSRPLAAEALTGLFAALPVHA